MIMAGEEEAGKGCHFLFCALLIILKFLKIIQLLFFLNISRNYLGREIMENIFNIFFIFLY